MSQPDKVILLVGSPKGEKSASNSIMSFLLEKFHKNGIESEKTYIVKHVGSDEGISNLVSQVMDSDIIILISPLYVDSIPAIVINAMEKIYEHKKNFPSKKQMMMAIFNCGFPEPKHNNLAIDMCKKFASDLDITWAGSVTIGMGASLEGRSLKSFGMAKNLRNGLNIVVESLANSKLIPKNAEIIASKPMIPLTISKFFMCTFGSILWGSQMDKSVKKKMYDRPYE